MLKTLKIGKTSITVKISVYTQSHLGRMIDSQKVAETTLIYVAVSKPGVKRVIENK